LKNILGRVERTLIQVKAYCGSALRTGMGAKRRGGSVLRELRAGEGGEKSGHRAFTGGRATDIHASTDADRRPLSFIFAGGEAADCKAGEQWLARLPADEMPHADKGTFGGW